MQGVAHATHRRSVMVVNRKHMERVPFDIAPYRILAYPDPLTAKPAELEVRGGCWFERDGLRVHLGVESDFRPARKAHPALAVTGIMPQP